MSSSRSSTVDLDGDEFMKSPAEDQPTVNKFARPTGFTATHGEQFSNKSEPRDFGKQYAAIYFTRLAHLKKVVLENASKALHRHPQLTTPAGEAPKVCSRVLDISPDRYCVIAGTVYKEMKLKPSILEEYNKGSGTTATTAAGQIYMSPDDTLVLEDEYGRVGLIGSPEKLNIRRMVSGLVIAVLGKEAAGGKFEVEEVFFPQLAKQQPIPKAITDAASSGAAPAYLLCVSGLSFGAPGQDPMPASLLMDYITGLLGSTADQSSSARIVRVLIAGNSLHRFEPKKGKEFGRAEVDPEEVSRPLKELDLLLTQLAAAVPVDILPGEQDPSNFTLPQQPFHKCLFPSASTYSTFKSTTNPTWLAINGLQVLATAGQNVNDLAKYAEAPSTVDFLESCLRWRHVAPTAPDTLGCFPYQMEDPFVLEESPHIYIVGNQPVYDTRWVEGEAGERVRVVALPSFAASGTAVLINLNSPTLEAQSISFKIAQPMEM